MLEFLDGEEFDGLFNGAVAKLNLRRLRGIDCLYRHIHANLW